MSHHATLLASMHTPNAHAPRPLRLLAVWLTCLAAGWFGGQRLAQSSTVFKWTDAQGVVHYSERPPGQQAPNARPMHMKVSPRQDLPAPASAPDAFAEAFRRQALPPTPASSPAMTPRPSSASESQGKEHGTDESRCTLARDILKGVLRHANGKPLDQHDMDTARNDVRLFCKKR